MKLLRLSIHVLLAEFKLQVNYILLKQQTLLLPLSVSQWTRKVKISDGASQSKSRKDFFFYVSQEMVCS